MSALETRALTLAYDETEIIAGLDLTIVGGRITALVGRNGCGKSTLLRALARLLRPRGGFVYLDGKSIFHTPTRRVAQRLGILPQAPVAPEGLTVRELVARGRYPHQGWLQHWSSDDEQAVCLALASTGMAELSERPLEALSGGQRQKAWIAMALAQETDILLLDEPTTYLDMAHQVEILDLLADLNRTLGRTIVMVLHDLNQACRYAHHLVAIRDGRVVAEGEPAAVISPELVSEVFGIQCCILADPMSGTPLCVPARRSSCPAQGSDRRPQQGHR